MIELKPCPFCSAEMKCVQDVWDVIGCGWKIVGAHSDDCYLRLRYGVNYHTKEDAINAWNKREKPKKEEKSETATQADERPITLYEVQKYLLREPMDDWCGTGGWRNDR